MFILYLGLITSESYLYSSSIGSKSSYNIYVVTSSDTIAFSGTGIIYYMAVGGGGSG